MKYCEKCHCIIETSPCPLCGNKKLRPPVSSDYCFVVKKERMWAEMYMEMLEKNDIPCVYQPVLGAVLSLVAFSTENYKVYVPFEKRNLAMELLDEFFKN